MYHFTAELPVTGSRMCKRDMENDVIQNTVRRTQMVPVLDAGVADRDGLSPDSQIPDATIMVELLSQRKK